MSRLFSGPLAERRAARVYSAPGGSPPRAGSPSLCHPRPAGDINGGHMSQPRREFRRDPGKKPWCACKPGRQTGAGSAAAARPGAGSRGGPRRTALGRRSAGAALPRARWADDACAALASAPARGTKPRVRVISAAQGHRGLAWVLHADR